MLEADMAQVSAQRRRQGNISACPWMLGCMGAMHALLLPHPLPEVSRWLAAPHPRPPSTPCTPCNLLLASPSTAPTCAQMRAMFYADGDGIGLEEVDAVCRPLSDVVDLMQLDTGLIIQNLKQVGGGGVGEGPGGRPGGCVAWAGPARRRLVFEVAGRRAAPTCPAPASLSPRLDARDSMPLCPHHLLEPPQANATLGRFHKSPRGTPAALDPDVLLRILCHRADHAASKYLKKDYKIPKKMPGALSSSVSDVASKAGGVFRRGK